MLSTSGSTGAPRLVVWRQDKLLAERRRWLAHVGLRADDVVYCRHTLDVAHGMDIHMLAALLRGARLALDDEHSTPDQLLDRLIEHRATMFSALPRHYQELTRAAQERTGQWRLDSLRLPLCGGAYLSGATVGEAMRVLGIHIRRIYGSTEFGMALGNMDDVDQTDVGMRPIEGIDVMVEPLSADTPEVGELITRSAYTSEGYFDDEAKTKAAFRDEWYHTGDVTRHGTDGRYRILGRTAEAIEAADGPVLAPELEAELAHGCPVDEVVVLAAHPDEYRPEALVLAKPHTGADADRVRAAIREVLSGMRIHGHVKLAERIPHIPVGKPDKNLIRRRW